MPKKTAAGKKTAGTKGRGSNLERAIRTTVGALCDFEVKECIAGKKGACLRGSACLDAVSTMAGQMATKKQAPSIGKIRDELHKMSAGAMQTYNKLAYPKPGSGQPSPTRPVGPKQINF